MLGTAVAATFWFGHISAVVGVVFERQRRSEKRWSTQYRQRMWLFHSRLLDIYRDIYIYFRMITTNTSDNNHNYIMLKVRSKKTLKIIKRGVIDFRYLLRQPLCKAYCSAHILQSLFRSVVGLFFPFFIFLTFDRRSECFFSFFSFFL